MLRLCSIPLILLGLLVSGVLFSLAFQLPLAEVATSLLSAETLAALRLTLLTSLGATGAAVLLGLPSGYFLARKSFRGKEVIDTLLDLPLTMTPLVAGTGLLFLLSRESLDSALGAVGIQLLFSPLGAVLAQAFIAAPIMTRSCRAAFMSISPRFEQAA
ncbi:MAG: molybdate ABC transporter permease subunit, partial [Deltaproteobacteria bacterium]|nr:molybdate ABC transporter permease subunit [Deltaproteobacteria bacterium]